MMMEKAYMPGFTMLAIATAPLFFETGLMSKIGMSFLAVFYTFALVQINFVGNKEFKPRLLAIDKLVIQCIAKNQFKVMAKQESAAGIWRGYWWATAADVLVRSTLQNKVSVTLYLYQSDENLAHAQQTNSFLFTNWWRDRSLADLNPRFFKLPLHPYDTINLSTYE